MKNWKMMMASLLLAAGVAGSVNGAITYFDVDPDVSVNGTIYSYNPLTGTGVFFGNPGFSFSTGPILLNADDKGLFSGSTSGWTVLGSGGNATALNLNDPISTASTTWSSNFLIISSQGTGVTSYYGIRNDTSVGWIQIRRDGNSIYTILASGMSDSGSILAGQTSEGGGGGGGGSAVPEPGTAAMLGVGVVMLSAARQRFRREA